ncbi:hypothetical protein P3T25_005194 [Paraburkholderia sp. GAS32]
MIALYIGIPAVISAVAAVWAFNKKPKRNSDYPTGLQSQAPQAAGRMARTVQESDEEPEYVRPDLNKPRYRQCPILTENEKEFFGRLVSAVPEYRIFPQVAMSAIIEPASSEYYMTYWNRIAMLRVDYAVYDQKFDLICVIELDDKTHDTRRKKDEKRDARMIEAGVRVLRYKSRSKPRPDAIRHDIMNPQLIPAPEPRKSMFDTHPA